MHIFKKSVAGLDPDVDNAANGNPNGSTVINQSSTLPPALPFSQQPMSAPPAQDQSAQIAELQRQVEELQRQTAGGSAGQSSQPF